MLRKERTHLFWAGNGGRDRGNNFRGVLLSLESSLTFSVWHWHLGSLPVLGTGPGVGVGNGGWHWHLGSLPALGTGPGVCPLRRGKWWCPEKNLCFLKTFSLFVIRDIPFLGCPVSFFDIPIWTDSGWPNKGFLQPMNISNFGQTQASQEPQTWQLVSRLSLTHMISNEMGHARICDTLPPYYRWI